MKYNLQIIQNYIDRGLIEKNDHPSLPISIYNYSRECQFTAAWDEITLNMRGTILDQEGNVIAKSFPKFFNMEEMKTIPNEHFQVFEKMDGSLIIGFKYGLDFHVASKGSFTSDQAIDAKKIIEEMDIDHDNLFKEGFTYLFEYIAPHNRIVVDYGNNRELCALAVIKNDTGEEAAYPILSCMSVHGFPVVKRYLGITDHTKLKSSIKPDHEGFVIRFNSGLRMKVKGEEYVRLHRLLTNFSNVDIWKCLKENTDMNAFLERVPDEFDVWVKKTIKELNYNFCKIHEHCAKFYQYFCFGKYGDIEEKPTKKELSAYMELCKEHKACQSVIFSMYDKKPYDHIIWRMIRPTYSKPFWNKTDEI